MKKTLFILLLVLLNGILFAQTTSNQDSELNTILKDINSQAKTDINLFKKLLIDEFKVKEEKIDQLIKNYDMQPADVFMSLQVAKQTTKPVEEVAETYKKNKEKGWGVIAKEMGIKPGSKEFHEMKDHAKGKNNKMKEEKGAKGKGNKGGNGNGKGKKK